MRCYLILLCLFISSCTKQRSDRHKNSVERSVDNHDSDYLDAVIQQEAMLVDIPIPLFDERIRLLPVFDNESDTLIFGYKSPLSISQAIDFFLNQMERYGWRHLVSFDVQDSLMQFESPDRYCTIVIKNSDSALSGSSIFIYIKRASIQARS